jgi:hypothetical protein
MEIRHLDRGPCMGHHRTEDLTRGYSRRGGKLKRSGLAGAQTRGKGTRSLPASPKVFGEPPNGGIWLAGLELGDLLLEEVDPEGPVGLLEAREVGLGLDHLAGRGGAREQAGVGADEETVRERQRKGKGEEKSLEESASRSSGGSSGGQRACAPWEEGGGDAPEGGEERA